MISQQLNIFLKEIQHCTYSQQYQRWQQYLDKTSHDQEYLLTLAYFLQHFPFNSKYWLEYIQATKFQEYHTALNKNYKSYQLWLSYLQQLKNYIYPTEPLKYKKELEKAIIQIGADTRSLVLYEQYYEMISENFRFEFYKKVFTRALINLESLFVKFKSWFIELSEEQIKGYYTKEFRGVINKDIQQQKITLYSQVESIYLKTINYREKRIKIEDEIKHYYFDGSDELMEESSLWRDLIILERENGVVQSISYCYERSLMAQTHDVSLWEEAFHYLENQTNKYSKVLSILRNNKDFFIKFNLNLYFYWCDMEERENTATARQMYQEISHVIPTFQVFQRRIQFEIRQKQYVFAKEILDKMLIQFQSDLELLSYILVEYVDFVLKYFKDLDYAKKLLKIYFDIMPFNNYLFTNYLEFMKNFENKEGYYDELMLLINEALVKAKKVLNQNYFNQLIQTVKYYLRSTLSSIYLIRISERRMMEFEEKIGKESTAVQ